MKITTRLLPILLATFTVTGCKVDLSLAGSGINKVVSLVMPGYDR